VSYDTYQIFCRARTTTLFLVLICRAIDHLKIFGNPALNTTHSSDCILLEPEQEDLFLRWAPSSVILVEQSTRLSRNAKEELGWRELSLGTTITSCALKMLNCYFADLQVKKLSDKLFLFVKRSRKR